MSVPSETTKVTFNCDGSLVAFAFTFKIFDDDDLVVTLTDSDGVETVLTNVTHYTVSGDEDGAFLTGGTVTTIATYASGNTITLARGLAYTQSSDYISNDALAAETLENDFDRVVMMIQQLNEQINRQFSGPITDAAGLSYQIPNVATRKNNSLGFDDAGEPIATDGSGQVVNAAMAAFVTRSTLALARTELDVYSQTEVDDLVEARGVAASLDNQTIDTDLPVAVGDPVFKNVTKETADTCDQADWTDDGSYIATTANTTTFKLSASLNLEKLTGGQGYTEKTGIADKLTFDATKELNLYVYVTAATLAKLAVSDCITIRYGIDTTANYYTWTFDRADLVADQWNFLTGMTIAAGAVTGTPGTTNYDSIRVIIASVADSDTWAAATLMIDHIFLSSDEEWQLATSSTPSPQGIMTAAGTIHLSGYTDQMSSLIPGQYYWMTAAGAWTTLPAESWRNTKLGYALSDTEFMVDIDQQGNATSQTIGNGIRGAVKGFIMGGSPGGRLQQIEGWIIPTELAGVLGTTLDQEVTNPCSPCAVAAGVAQYSIGYQTSATHQADVMKLTFSTEAGVDQHDRLEGAVESRAGMTNGGNTKGYGVGGDSGPGTYRNWVDSLTFASDSVARSTTAIMTHSFEGAGGVSAPLKGYQIGGVDGGYNKYVQTITWATEVDVDEGELLATARGYVAAISGPVHGYVMGGHPGYLTTIEKVVYSSDTFSVPSASLTAGRFGLGGISGLAKGWCFGGYTGSGSRVIDNMVYADDSSDTLDEELLDAANWRMTCGQY